MSSSATPMPGFPRARSDHGTIVFTVAVGRTRRKNAAMNDELKALLERGDTDAALALATKRLAEARSGGDDASLALALIDDARAQMAHGDRDEAVMTVDEAISRARKGLGPKDARYAEALELGGEIAAAASMPNAADARFRAAIEVLESAGIAGAPLAHALLHHGLFRRSQGDAVGAVRAFSAVVTRAGEDPEARAFGATALTEMGFVVLDEGQVASAREVGDRALEVFLSLGRARRVEVADAMALVGLAALRQGEPSTARDFLETACEVYRGTKAPAGGRHALAHHHLGRALAELGEKAAARAALLDAIDLYREGSGERIAIEQEVLDLARG